MKHHPQSPEPPEEEVSVDEVERNRMPLMDHLRELRNRILVSVVAVVIGMAICWFRINDAISFLLGPANAALTEVGKAKISSIVIISPFEGMTTWMNVAVIGGLVLASPVVAYQMWAFIAPGLYHTERRLIVPLAASSTLLFLGGAGFCFYVMFPFAFPFFFTVLEDVGVQLSVQAYLAAVVKMIVAFGLSFQLPIATFFVARMGLVDHKDMTGAFRYAVVAIFVIAAILTPPDPLSQALLAVPLIGLYGVSIAVAYLFSTKGKAREVLDETESP